MTDVIIFGGTTEGRELAQWLAKKGIAVLVSVATEYGKQVLEQEENLTVHTGRLDFAGMEHLIRQQHPKLVLDATHPHAREVTRNVRQVCEILHMRCQRIVRGEERADTGHVIWVDTPRQAAQLLLEDDQAVLLTTGSKELEIFTSEPKLRGRIYARVLPDSNVLAACEALGIRGRQLIAMQGPFSTEMNCALMKAVEAGWLVTKESGSSGGFEEKMEAAKRCGAKAIVIRRPREEASGLTVRAVKQMLEEMFDLPPEKEKRILSLIGMGMGTGKQLTQEALQVIRESDAVLGAPRMLQDIQNLIYGKRTAAVYLGKDILAWMQENQQYCRIAAIYSGDTGFHSGAASLVREIEQKEQEIQIKVYPGISTVSCLCARFQLSWENLYLASAHGQKCDPAEILKKHENVFLLLGGTSTVQGVCRRLTEAGLGKTHVFAGARLGYEDEKLLSGTAQSLQNTRTDGLAAVILKLNMGENGRTELQDGQGPERQNGDQNER